MFFDQFTTASSRESVFGPGEPDAYDCRYGEDEGMQVICEMHCDDLSMEYARLIGERKKVDDLLRQVKQRAVELQQIHGFGGVSYSDDGLLQFHVESVDEGSGIIGGKLVDESTQTVEHLSSAVTHSVVIACGTSNNEDEFIDCSSTPLDDAKHLGRPPLSPVPDHAEVDVPTNVYVVGSCTPRQHHSVRVAPPAELTVAREIFSGSEDSFPLHNQASSNETHPRSTCKKSKRKTFTFQPIESAAVPPRAIDPFDCKQPTEVMRRQPLGLATDATINGCVPGGGVLRRKKKAFTPNPPELMAGFTPPPLPYAPRARN